MVAKYLSLAGAAGQDWQATAELDETALERRLLGRSAAQTGGVEADFARVHVEPHRKGGRTGDATIADAILDRLLSCSQRLALKGKSLRPDRLAAIPAPDKTSTAPGLSSQTVKISRADRPPNPLRLASEGT